MPVTGWGRRPWQLALAGSVFLGCLGQDRPILESTTARATGQAQDDPTHVAAQATTTPAEGARRPAVLVTVFTDLQCAFCARTRHTVSRVLETWPSRVQVQHRHFPLTFHELARPAARAAMAAHRQGAFVAVQDRLFEEQKVWAALPGEARFREYALALAEEMGLDAARFLTDYEAPSVDEAIVQDEARALLLGLRGTPTLLVNGRVIHGRAGFRGLARAIRSELAEAAHAARRGVLEGDMVQHLTSRNVGDPQHVAWLVDGEPAPQEALAALARRELLGHVPPIPMERWKVEVTGDEPVTGAGDDALVTLVAFEDFECPFCRKLEPTLRALVDRYPAKIRLVFKHLPLPFHRRAEQAARGAWCAHAQGEFQAFRHALYESGVGDDAHLKGLAGKVGLDVDVFSRCVGSPAAREAILADIAEAEAVGARGTPVLYINGRKAAGGRHLEELARVIEEEIPMAEATRARLASGGNLYGAITARGRRSGGLASEVTPLALDEAPRLGAPEAATQLVIFDDGACEGCGSVVDAAMALVRHGSESASLILVTLPGDDSEEARTRWAAGHCAHRLGRYWTYREALGKDAGEADRRRLLEAARHGGVHMGQMVKCLADPGTDLALRRTRSAVLDAGVRHAPTIFVNGRRYDGSRGYDEAALRRLTRHARRSSVQRGMP